jgi:hypothetical protein
MAYPQITLENSNLISVSCSPAGDQVIVTAKSNEAFYYMTSYWPPSGLVLFTNVPGCNPATSRGIYLSSDAFTSPNSPDLTFIVTAKNFTDVATTVAIRYGTLITPNPSGQGDDVGSSRSSPTSSFAASCTDTSSGAPSLTASGFTPAGTPPLNSKELEVYNVALSILRYDSDGNVLWPLANTQNASVPISPYDPDNSTAQAELEDLLQSMGLRPLSTLVDIASNGIRGICPPPAAVGAPSKMRRRDMSLETHPLSRRSWWDITKDIAKDIFCDEHSVWGDLVEAGCELLDIEETIDAAKCVVNQCYRPKTVITYYTPPPATIYNFDYSWSITFPSIKQTVLSTRNTEVGCVNCGFSISNLRFEGEIIINATSRTIDKAHISK